jgi:hypothetical protein
MCLNKFGILSEFSKCLISHNIGCLIKTPLKKQHPDIFSRGPWATVIFNNMFVVGFLYRVQLFFEVKMFQKPFLLSFAMAFVSYLIQCILASHPWFYYGISKKTMVILWIFYGVSMIFYWVSKGMSMVFLWDSYGASKVCLWDFHWIPMGFLWHFYDISMGFLWDFHDISIEFLWYWVPMIFLWVYYGTWNGFLWYFNDLSMICPWYFYGISLGFLWDFHDISFGFLL